MFFFDFFASTINLKLKSTTLELVIRLKILPFLHMNSKYDKSHNSLELEVLSRVVLWVPCPS